MLSITLLIWFNRRYTDTDAFRGSAILIGIYLCVEIDGAKLDEFFFLICFLVYALHVNMFNLALDRIFSTVQFPVFILVESKNTVILILVFCNLNRNLFVS